MKTDENEETRTDGRAGSGTAGRYFAYLLVVLVLVQIMDAYSTAYTATFPSKIIEEFLPGLSPNEADAIMAISIGIATTGMFFVFVNQSLCDKLGRKAMLVLTTLGMALSALLLTLSSNIWSYTFFLFLTYLFFSSDVWLIYVNEESAPEKRGAYSNLVMALGILGPVMIPLLRNRFITDASPVGSWRGMSYFLVALGLPLSLVVALTVRETSKYLEVKARREGETGTGSHKPVNLRRNLSAILNSPRRTQVLVLLAMSFLLGFNYLFQQLGESYIQNNTALLERDVNNIITIIALTVIVGYLLTGFLADRLGRVPLVHFFSVMMVLGALMLFAGGKVPTKAGQFGLCAAGLATGYVSFNGLHIALRLVTVEIVPTERRGTGSGLRAFVQAVGVTTGFLLGSPLIRAWGLGVVFVAYAVPLLVNLVLTAKYVPETKGTDLSRVE